MSKKGIFIFLSSFIKKIYLCNWWEQFNCQKNFLTLIFLKTLTYFFFNCVYLRFRDDSIYFHKTSYTGERNQIVTVINFWCWPLYVLEHPSTRSNWGIMKNTALKLRLSKEFRDVIYINQTLNLFWSLGLSGHYLFTLINFKLLIVLFNLCLRCLQWHLISRNTIKSIRLRKIIFFCAFQKKFRNFKICNDYFGLAKLARESCLYLCPVANFPLQILLFW